MRKAALAVVIVLAGLGLACGGGPAATPPPKGGGAPKPPPLKTAAAEELDAPVQNERWEIIQEHFARFARRPVSAHKDVFRSHLDKYVPPIQIQVTAVEPETPESTPIISADELDPLKRYSADSYKLGMVMTGTGTPRALVQDPKGTAYEVRVDSEIGNERGVVEAITQYEVIVRQPDEMKPVRLSIRPEVFDIETLQAKQRALQDAGEDFAEPLSPPPPPSRIEDEPELP